MKKLFLGFILLGSFSTLASELSYERYKRNFDGTTTFYEPFIQRETNYSISKGSSKDGTCKALGFSNYLEDSVTENDLGSDLRATIGEDGRLRSLEKNSFKMDTITCYSDNYLSVIKPEYFRPGKLANITVMFQPRLVRGSEEYVIAGSSSLDGICRAAGFSSYVSESVVSHSTYPFGHERAYLDSDGKYIARKLSHKERTIDAISCFN